MYKHTNESRCRRSSLNSKMIEEEQSFKSSNSRDSTDVAPKPPLPQKAVLRYSHSHISKESHENPVESQELTIEDSVRLLTQNTPQFIQNSIQESRFEQPTQNTLFSFLHCYPPTTLLKLIPTQCGCWKLGEDDCDKLAIVPTEVLLDIKESRRGLLELVEAQRQVIGMLQKGGGGGTLGNTPSPASSQVESYHYQQQLKQKHDNHNCVLF